MRERYCLLVAVCLYVVTSVHCTDIVVKIRGDDNEADRIALRHGLYNHKKVLQTRSYFHFKQSSQDRARRSANDAIRDLIDDPQVSAAYEAKEVQLSKRALNLDELLSDRYYNHRDRGTSDRRNPFDQSHSKTSNRGNSLYELKEQLGIVRNNLFTAEDERSAADQAKRDELDLSFLNDRSFKDMWYLVNRGQEGASRYVDINVLPAWRAGVCGVGVKVLIIDDGLDHTHEDLIDNYDPSLSDDFQDEHDDDPMPPKETAAKNSHGTKCAGEIAATANNSICTVGVAFCASFGGIRLLDGSVTDVMEAEALTHLNQIVDLMSASWGPTDDGLTMGGDEALVMQALEEGAKLGRNGKGTIFVFASGNGGASGDTTNADALISSRFTIGIGSVNQRGERAYYSERGSSATAVVPVGGPHTLRKRRDVEDSLLRGFGNMMSVTTTSVNQGCTNSFIGTSAAAPLATGCVSLLVQVNSEVTYRDVQHIIADTARIPTTSTADEDQWIMNGGGYHYSTSHGFGLLDCSAMSNAADGWKTVPPAHQCDAKLFNVDTVVKAGDSKSWDIEFGACADDPDKAVGFVEHVEIKFDGKATQRGAMELTLLSPQGTTSYMLFNRPKDVNPANVSFLFTSIMSWGEDPKGMWTFTVSNNPLKDAKTESKITVNSFQMIVHGPAEYSGQSGEQSKGQSKVTADDLMNQLPDTAIAAFVSAYGSGAVRNALKTIADEENSAAKPRSRKIELSELKELHERELYTSMRQQVRDFGPIPDLKKRRGEERKAAQAWKRTLEGQEEKRKQEIKKKEMKNSGSEVSLEKRLHQKLHAANVKLDQRLQNTGTDRRETHGKSLLSKLRSMASVLNNALE